jgi:hypothetical protein
MPELPDVVPGEPVASTWGNDIRDRTLQRYADAAARDTENPTPDPGDLAFTEDDGATWVYRSGGWSQFQLTDVPGLPGTVRTLYRQTISAPGMAAGAVGVVEWDTGGAITDWNKTVYSILPSGANGQSTQAFWTLWARNGDVLDLRCVRPQLTSPAGSGTAFALLQLVEYW